MIRLAALLCALALLAPSLAQANFKIITTDQLKARLDKGEPLLLIDALPGPRHQMGHIPGSINIPFGLFDQMKDKLPEDKARGLVFYCLGPKCTLSKRAAKAALELGYTNVYVYNEGIPGWSKKGYKLQTDLELKKVKINTIKRSELLKNIEQYYVVDVMYASDFNKGHIKGSVNINLDELESKIPTLPKDKTIVVVDHANKLSKIAVWLLHHRGVTNVKMLEGGKLAMIKAGERLKKN
ncbi:rhodanese-like domain-containing protein [Myxococcota bacterium]|nr:rhodanese-like domain-containing protein [Myxococcota bacterium]